MNTSERVRAFSRNESGRDFVVGDIHGCFDNLRSELAAVSFNERSDRLFSVGDLVDRGPNCEESIDWIARPWFHAVRGNHEQMAIGVSCGRHSLINYIQNGGGWFVEMPESRQRLFAEAFDTLPFAMEVDHGIGLVGIVHAEVVGGDWRTFCSALIAKDQSNNKFRTLAETALWARHKITEQDTTPISNVARVYVGHTPVADRATLGNVHYIDTGAVFGNKLTMVEIT